MTDDSARMQGILDSLVDHGAVGALARFQDDERTWAGSSGVTELGIERPVAAHGSFRIGSVTKAFTATVLLQLVVEGALRLEDSVDSWLPGLIPDGGAITVHGHGKVGECVVEGSVLMSRVDLTERARLR